MRTILRTIMAETEEKRSRFLAFLVPYHQFEETLASLRNEHRKAAHHVTAHRHVLADGRMDESGKDDGEPGGTSGMPTLRTLQGADLADVGIITVRYFGGIKLGTGGLARAYSAAAAAAIAEAEAEGALTPWLKMVRAHITVPFAQSGAIEQLMVYHGVRAIARDYDEAGINLTLEGEENALEALKTDLADPYR